MKLRGATLPPAMRARLKPASPDSSFDPVIETSAGPVNVRLPLPPSANRYWKPVLRRKGSRVWAELVLSPEARRYKNGVQVQWRNRVRPISGPVELRLEVHFANGRSDLSNRVKVLEDALNGIAYFDDRQVQELHVVRGENADEPFVEVSVCPRPCTGIDPDWLRFKGELG